MIVAIGLTAVCAAKGQVTSQSKVLEAITAKERAMDSGKTEDWKSALRLFRDAHQIRPSAETAYEMGVAASALHQDDLAFEAYSEALELGLTDVAYEKATRFLAAHRPRLAWIQVRCASGSRVLIRGIERGHVPLERAVVALPGLASVECRPSRGAALHREVTLVAGEEQLVVLGSPEDPSSIAEPPSIEKSPSASPLAPDADRPVFGRALSRESLLWTDPAAPTAVVPLQPEALRTSQQPPRRSGWLLVGSGTTILAWSGYLALMAWSEIDEGRRALAHFCAVQPDGPDTCRYAKAGQQAPAQGHSDSIATWKAVRAVSLAGAGLGAIASLVGAGMITGLVGGKEQSRQSTQLAVTQTGLAIEIRATFD